MVNQGPVGLYQCVIKISRHASEEEQGRYCGDGLLLHLYSMFLRVIPKEEPMQFSSPYSSSPANHRPVHVQPIRANDGLGDRWEGGICRLLQGCRQLFLTWAGILPHCTHEKHILVNTLTSTLQILSSDILPGPEANMFYYRQHFTTTPAVRYFHKRISLLVQEWLRRHLLIMALLFRMT